MELEMVRSNAAAAAMVAGLGLFALLAVITPRIQARVAEQAEIVRIQGHLARVEQELRARDVSNLTPRQRAAREVNIRALHAYWIQGRFPHNHDFHERTPYFIDRHGTRCAMAHLIESSGGGTLVRRVAATCNNARISELAGDPELIAWLGAAGLTLEEAARIQPYYGGDDVVPDARTDWQPLYSVATVCASAFSAAAVIMNEKQASELDVWGKSDFGEFALTAGCVSLGLGIAGLTAADDGVQGLGAMNVFIGAISSVVGIVALTNDESESKDSTGTCRLAFAAAPFIGRGAGGGAALTLRF
jgi:hypothetical protein